MKKVITLLAIICVAAMLLAGCQEAPAPAEHTHTLVHNEEKAPTCINNGIKEHWYCPECNGRFTDEAATKEVTFFDLEVEELGHTGGTATCTEAAICERCEKPYGAALGHTGGTATCAAPATCERCSQPYGEIGTHTEGEDGTCTGCNAAMVESVEELVAAIESASSIVLLNDISASDIIVINKSVTLDGNGKTITSTAGRAINISGADGVTIKNLTVVASGERGFNIIQNATNVVIENVTATAANYTVNAAGSAANAVITIKNSTLTGLNVVNMAAAGVKVTVADCKLICNDQTDIESYTVLTLNKDAQGGSITATNIEFVISGGSTKASNGTNDINAVTIDGSNEEVKINIAYIPYGDYYYSYATFEAAFEQAAKDGSTVYLTSEKHVEAAETAGYCVAEIEGKFAVAAEHAWKDATCTAAKTCTVCGATEGEALGHADANADYKCDACSTKMLPADGETLTIPQALAVAKVAGSSYTTQKYYITGVIKNVYNTTYGNMYIKDEAGNEICIYGLYTWNKAVRYDKMDYKPVAGDEITVYTVLGAYKTTYQGKDAWLDEVVAHEHDYKAVVTEPTCTKAGFTTHTCTICDGYYTDSETEALGHTTENGTCERCGLTLGGDAPAYETFTADFDTIASANSSYGTYKTKAGWQGTNCAVVQGGSGDSNPTFKVLGATSATKGYVLNGKTSAKGKLVSPTLSGGISKITFNYTNVFSESKGVDITITIKQNGTAVATKKLDNNSVTQLKAYTFEWDLAGEGVAVSGDFTIEITNNSPSNNSSKNKDRVAIWNLEWNNNPA